MKSDVETDSVGMSQVFYIGFFDRMQPFDRCRGIYGRNYEGGLKIMDEKIRKKRNM